MKIEPNTPSNTLLYSFSNLDFWLWSRQLRSALVQRSPHIILFLLFFWQLNAFADSVSVTPAVDLTAIVESALKNLDKTDLEDDWYFTMEVVEGDELRVIHSDPYRDKYKRRQLISVNGLLPDEDSTEEFHDAEVERVDALDPEATGYSYMVDVQTLQLLKAEDGFASFSFVPKVKALEGARDQLRGVLVLNLDSRQVDQLEITNSGTLSPAFSVTVDTYRMTLRFHQQYGENLLSKLESHAAGKAGFVKSFESLVEISFSDYKRAER
ncbi:Uncharacterised protein [Halioglobus japonicus]|nr:Uncharacterised protein [Halioglobus japonicus]